MKKFEVAQDIVYFYNRVSSLLHSKPCANNVIIGLLQKAHAELPFMFCVTENDKVLAAGMHMPPQPMLLAAPMLDNSMDVVVEELSQLNYPFAETVMVSEYALEFAKKWEKRNLKIKAVLRENQRFHMLTEVRWNNISRKAEKGYLHLVGPDELHLHELCVKWYCCFAKDIHVTTTEEHARKSIMSKIAANSLFIWRTESEYLSMAGISATPPDSFRVGPVYTPPEHRNFGYATSITAYLTDLFNENKKCKILCHCY